MVWVKGLGNCESEMEGRMETEWRDEYQYV